MFFFCSSHSFVENPFLCSELMFFVLLQLRLDIEGQLRVTDCEKKSDSGLRKTRSRYFDSLNNADVMKKQD